MARGGEAKRETKSPLGRPRHTARITLKWILNEMEGCGPDSFGSGQKRVADSCGEANDRLCYMQCREFLEQLGIFSLLKEEFNPWS